MEKPGTEQKFRELVAQWEEGIRCYPSNRDKTEHPAYREIVGMGKDAIPHLLRLVEDTPRHEFMAALHEITGENPVREADAGNLRQMASAWIRWGEREGYLPPGPQKKQCGCPPH